jgi:hypothetical protein
MQMEIGNTLGARSCTYVTTLKSLVLFFVQLCGFQKVGSNIGKLLLHHLFGRPILLIIQQRGIVA